MPPDPNDFETVATRVEAALAVGALGLLIINRFGNLEATGCGSVLQLRARCNAAS